MRIILPRPKRRKSILTSKTASNDQAKLAGYGH